MAINIGENNDKEVTYVNSPDINRVLFKNLSEGASKDEIAEAVNAWIEEHPEAVTTVQDGSILPVKLDSSNEPSDGYVLSWNATAGKFEWIDLQSDITELKNDFNDIKVAVEATSFADRIDTNDQYISFTDFDENIVKYTSLGAYNGRLVTSQGYDCWAFKTPYEGFEFVLATTTVFIVDSFPVGTANEYLDNPQSLTGVTQSGNFKKYTVNASKGTIVLFELNKTYAQLIGTTLFNHFTMDGLELSALQDNFVRSSVVKSVSPYIPVEISKATGKLVTYSTGGLSNNASYDTYYFKVPVAEVSVTCTNGYRAVLTTKDPTTITNANYLAQQLYEYESGRVNTFTAELGEYVVISMNVNDYSAIDLKTDMVNFYELPTLRLSYGQKNSFYRFTKSGSATYLYVYYVSGSKIVGWELHNVPAQASNSDTWQIGHVMGYDFDGMSLSNGVELVSGGEFELAFKEHGASDYCGGNNHGDETTDTFTLHIDGKTVDLTNLDTDYHVFDRIDVIEEAIVNRCDTPSEDILRHQKLWTFSNGKVAVRQTIKYLEELQVDGALVCMFAANRTAYPYGVRQGGVAIEDMSVQGYTHLWTKENNIFYEMWGDHATAKIKSSIQNGNNTAGLWINDTSTLNKLYYEAYADANSAQPVTVPQDTILTVETEYDIAYN